MTESNHLSTKLCIVSNSILTDVVALIAESGIVLFSMPKGTSHSGYVSIFHVKNKTKLGDMNEDTPWRVILG